MGEESVNSTSKLGQLLGKVRDDFAQQEHHQRKLVKLHEKLDARERMLSISGAAKLSKAYQAALEEAVTLQQKIEEASDTVHKLISSLNPQPEEQASSQEHSEEAEDIHVGDESPADATANSTDIDLEVGRPFIKKDEMQPKPALALPVGTPVAVLTRPEPELPQEDWILATIIRFDPYGDLYEVEDVEMDEGAQSLTASPSKPMTRPAGRRFFVKSASVRELPQSDEDALLATENIKVKQKVLALFPGTTCLYPATVVNTAHRRKKTRDFAVKFSDDDVSSRPCPPRFIIPIPNP